MGRTKLSFGKCHWANFPELAAVTILFTGCFPTSSIAQQQGQKTFFIAGRSEQRIRRRSAK